MNDLQNLMLDIAARCPGGKLPADYLVIDFETSGLQFNPKEGSPSVIVQVGYAAVVDGKISTNTAHYLQRAAGTMSREAEQITQITDGMLQQFGEPPMEFYQRFVPLLELYIKSKCMIIGHNVVSFDVPFLLAELNRAGIAFSFDENLIIDTGCLFKAAQIGVRPGPVETLGSFLQRIRYTRSRVKWNLAYAMAALELDRALNLDLEQAHDAGFDCFMVHLLFEKLKTMDIGDAFERLKNGINS